VCELERKTKSLYSRTTESLTKDRIMTHKDLTVWKESIELVVAVYELAQKLPSDEKFGLISQLKRAAVSVPSNISEGAGRSSTKEFMRFIDIANGSLSELETQLIIVEKLNLYKTAILIETKVTPIRKMLYKLKQALIKKTAEK